MDYKEYTVKVYADSGKYWYLNNQLHREDGPAVEYASGTKRWYLNDKPHREDGPAFEYADGSKHWFLNGKYLTEADFLIKTKKTDVCDGKVIEIDGKKYKLTSIV